MNAHGTRTTSPAASRRTGRPLARAPWVLALALVLAFAFALAGAGGCGGSSDSGAGGGGAGGDASDAAAAPDTGGPGGADVAEDTAAALDVAPADVLLVEDVADGDVDPDAASTPDVPDPLALAEVVPPSGHAAGGELVTVHGTGFPDGCEVLFGQSRAPTVIRLSSSELTVQTPPGRPGLVDVALRCPGIEVSPTLADGFLFFRDVVVSAIVPAEGPVEGGTPVEVRGTGFASNALLTVGGRRAIRVEVIDDQTIIAITPPGEAGPADVHVSQSGALAALRRGFTYTRKPRVDLVLPGAGPVEGGETVVVQGAGFASPATVWFGDIESPSVAVLGEDAVEALTPPAAAPGAVAVSVSTPRGLARLDAAYHYLAEPPAGGQLRLLAVTPAVGNLIGGERVALIASGLPTNGDLTVLFGGGAAAIESIDAERGVVVLRTPAAASAGAVDVAALGATGGDTIPDGFTYVRGLAVSAVAPPSGPAAGGTPLTVLGDGFRAGAQLFVGALPATGVQVLGEGRIQAVTPVGSPGPADVRVVQGAEQARLEDGFLFMAPFDLYGLVPDTGAVAGGTYVEFFGAGFDAATVPSVAGRPCTHVTVVDPTRITAKTPPGEVGTVDVAVRSAGGERALPQAFTYFDPTSESGGTWGGDVEGSVNITVIDTQIQPVADAYVLLRTDPDTPYQGWTNTAGQITFSGPDVLGVQMVSASKECYASSSVVEFDATNITLVLTYVCASGGAPPPGIPPATITGRVYGLGKYVIPPPGSCYDRPIDPVLCMPCAVDGDCQGGTVCEPVADDGTFCVPPCDGETPCPDGYTCRTVAVGTARCQPDSGDRVAICRATRPEILQLEEPAPGPGMEADREGVYSITTRYGEQAVVCIGGVRDEFSGIFTPMRMGVARHLQPTLDAPLVEDADVFLDIPLTRTIAARADEVAFNPALGPELLAAFVYLDLGSDGLWDFEADPISFDPAEPLRFENMPAELSGAIYDASYAIVMGAFSLVNDADNLPYTLTVRRRIDTLDDDSVLVRDVGGGWQAVSTGIDRDVNALWGTADTNAWAVGARGLLVHHDGFGWSAQPAATDKRRLNGLWGMPEGSPAYAVGEAGTVLVFSGASWSRRDIPNTAELRAVWGSGPNDVWVVGSYSTWHWDGAAWQPATGSASRDLYAIWGASASDVWAVGAWGTVLHYDGAAWTTVNAGTGLRLRGVWGAAADDVFAVGERGLILHWDGVAWTPMDSGTTEHLRAVTGRSTDEVWAVGTRGTVLRWTGERWRRVGDAGYTNALNAVWAAPVTEDGGGKVLTMGTHELLLGPMLSVPRFQNPTKGGPLVGDTIAWTVDPEPTQADFTLLQVDIPGLFGDTPVWTFLADGSVTSVPVPDFAAIAGTPGIGPGFYKLTAVRGFKEGFDIDSYDFFDLNQLTWRSWSIDVITFTR